MGGGGRNTKINLLLSNQQRNDNSRLRETQSMALDLNYGLTERLTLNVLLSWIQKRRRIFSPFSRELLSLTSVSV